MDTQIPDQREMWDSKHQEGNLADLRNQPNPFAEIAEKHFPKNSKVLDLGCGTGGDSAFFASRGHKVLATDFSKVVINQNRKYFKNTGIEFEVFDMSDPFPYKDSSFDAVYSHLALHYYTDAVTKQIFSEILRTLKSDGVFAFACKSTNDSHFSRGAGEVEANLIISAKGHIRHFFSEDYVEELLGSNYKIELLEEIEEPYSGEDSAIVRCIASKL